MSLASTRRAKLSERRPAQGESGHRASLAAYKLLSVPPADRSLTPQELIAMARAARARTSWH
ncbi:hypothetical protein Mnod_8740 (plasmid) [Methylobacterium nodulans ORS 2060]|uniref:Uncharacterized protein n=1 Tax=Methylobacterium nodulans (strain LMG 21967 / CNCM I-2342 / ORS 2060) TaxID=460265 RepID=B8IWK6_METNO|nr:hypothetical protein Mnod_8740 [Methylobacterium nodulans ORS 2060]